MKVCLSNVNKFRYENGFSDPFSGSKTSSVTSHQSNVIYSSVFSRDTTLYGFVLKDEEIPCNQWLNCCTWTRIATQMYHFFKNAIVFMCLRAQKIKVLLQIHYVIEFMQLWWYYFIIIILICFCSRHCSSWTQRLRTFQPKCDDSLIVSLNTFVALTSVLIHLTLAFASRFQVEDHDCYF